MAWGSHSPNGRPSAAKTVMLWLMAAFYLAAGVVHLVATEKFLPIVPDWVPLPYDTVVATGVCEILGAIALLIPRLRKLSGVMLAAYAVCVFPANLKHAFESVNVSGLPNSWWYHGPRLAMQPVLVWWALFATDVVSWPFRAKPAR